MLSWWSERKIDRQFEFFINRIWRSKNKGNQTKCSQKWRAKGGGGSLPIPQCPLSLLLPPPTLIICTLFTPFTLSFSTFYAANRRRLARSTKCKWRTEKGEGESTPSGLEEGRKDSWGKGRKGEEGRRRGLSVQPRVKYNLVLVYHWNLTSTSYNRYEIDYTKTDRCEKENKIRWMNEEVNRWAYSSFLSFFPLQLQQKKMMEITMSAAGKDTVGMRYLSILFSTTIHWEENVPPMLYYCFFFKSNHVKTPISVRIDACYPLLTISIVLHKLYLPLRQHSSR